MNTTTSIRRWRLSVGFVRFSAFSATIAAGAFLAGSGPAGSPVSILLVSGTEDPVNPWGARCAPRAVQR